MKQSSFNRNIKAYKNKIMFFAQQNSKFKKLICSFQLKFLSFSTYEVEIFVSFNKIKIIEDNEKNFQTEQTFMDFSKTKRA